MDRRLELISEMTFAIWLHLLMVAAAVVIGGWVLWRRKGDRLHKMLGRTWVGMMAVGAISSFWIREIMSGGFSPIHILSCWTLYSLVTGVIVIRRNPRTAQNIQAHRTAMMSLYASGLAIAGGFTLLPNRLLGRLSFGESWPVINYVMIALVVAAGLWLTKLAYWPRRAPAH